MSPANAEPESLPRPLLAALVVVLLEAGALLGMAVAFLVDVLRGVAFDVLTTVVMAAFFVGFALLLAAGGRALWRRHRWGRGPVVTWQLLQGASGVAMAPVLSPWITVAMVALAAVGVVGAMWPSSRAWANGRTAPGAVA